MSKYQEHMKPHWDTIGWFSTLLVRMAYTHDEQERKELMLELASITDDAPQLRPVARKAGVTGLLPDDIGGCQL